MAREREAREQLRAVPFEDLPPPTVVSYLKEGDSLREAGEAPRALWVYLKAHDLDRSDPRPLLRIAGLHLGPEPERAVAIVFAATLAVALCLVGLVGSWSLGLVVFAIVPLVAELGFKVAKRKRRERLDLQLPDTLTTIANSMRSGLTLVQAM